MISNFINKRMKKYDREKKQWISEEVYNKKYKRRDKNVCKGGKPHDYILVLPDHITYIEGKYDFNAEKYYELIDDEVRYFIEQGEKMSKLGIKSRYSDYFRQSKATRHYICSVCKKKDIARPE